MMLYWLPAVVWMAVIFYLSGRTGSELGSLFPFIKDFNPGHILAYFILGLLAVWPLIKSQKSRPYLKALLICFLYGISDEFHQYFVPTRTPDIIDLLRDMLGACSAVILYYFYYSKKSSSRQGG